MSTISVIIPVYNVEHYLRRCVDSITKQTFMNFEVILVDDGSLDSSGEICDECATKDSRIHVIHQKNGGLSAARNAGIEWAFSNSDSEWISFIDSDDWVHPCFLEFLYRAVKEFDTDVSACEIIRVESELPFSVAHFCADVMDWEKFYIEGWDRGVIACNKLYRKELFSKIRYPVGKINEDEFVTYLILEKASKVAVLDSALYFYYQNTEGIMKSNFSQKKLDGVIALSEQCQFAKRHGYRDFYMSRMEGRFSLIKGYKNACEKTTGLDNRERKKIMRFLQADLRKILIAEGKTIAPFKDYSYYYQWAFPKINWCYWAFVIIIEKIKRIFR